MHEIRKSSPTDKHEIQPLHGSYKPNHWSEVSADPEIVSQTLNRTLVFQEDEQSLVGRPALVTAYHNQGT